MAQSKRPRITTGGLSGDGREEQPPLLPGLPDHLAQQCLAHLPAALLSNVCHRWRRLLYSPSFPPFLSLYALLSNANPDSPDPIAFYSYDPISATWVSLPPPPPEPSLRRLLLRHPSFISRTLPVQSVAAGDHLVVVAGTADGDRLLPAISHPILFHPASRQWRIGPLFTCPRRWCAAGAAAGAVYLASGVGSEYNSEIARYAERWDLSRRGAAWEPVAPLKDGRFSREAVEAVFSKGKLCMVNLRGMGLKYGAIYDVESDRWEEMPEGMLAGWTGPAAAAAEDDQIYVVDEESGEMREYSWEQDAWRAVARSERMKGAAQVAAGGGRVCVAGGGGEEVVVVDVRRRPGRMWTVLPPAGSKVVALHVLPRTSPSGPSEWVGY